MNSSRQQTFAIIGSVVGTLLVSTIAIATLIVLQHDSMRRSVSAELQSMRTAASEEHAAIRSAASGEHAALRDNIAEIRDNIRMMRSDISDLRERMARVEVHVGVTAESP